MGKAPERLEGLFDNLVRSFAPELSDKAHAAGVVLFPAIKPSRLLNVGFLPHNVRSSSQGLADTHSFSSHLLERTP